jgi:uncharacterized membrane protein (UPF0127 family)
MIRRRPLLAAALLLTPLAAAAQNAPQPELPKEQLVIVTRDGQHHVFYVEMALTPEQQETGLMWRTHVPADGGMLFVWPGEEVSQMWMKNTVSSLDMIFIRSDGVIDSIAERTTPRSLAVIRSAGPVHATLELAAGTAERLGIRVGDRVEAKAFGDAG